ncbi:24195_t:CDS:2 [Gigaspora margarita]|uniref:24195_t:CDS:1 n=1 Tax=Gigaspora margarita TaxID=4874 RepID=A0ABM8VZQ5_GIGMA|nr:24195_t:CDS:2 [Gigaspora margarita]
MSQHSLLKFNIKKKLWNRKKEISTKNNKHDLDQRKEIKLKCIPTRPEKIVKNKALVESDQETLVKNDDINKEKKNHTKNS